MANNYNIAKNTLFLYFRMLCTIAVSLYTSRVVLQVLGVEDYGTYQVVGGISSMLSYVINGSLASGSSRFIIYEIGKGTSGKLRETFSTLMTIHILIGIAVILLAEIFGLYFLYNKLVIPEERFGAALFTFHLSIIATFIGITQVPYTALIIGHERMNIYAYMSIIEAVLKLSIVYVLMFSNWDKLELYALLLFIVQTGITLFYRFYCIRSYKDEASFKLIWDKRLIKKVLSFSSWNLIENTSISLNNQGTILLLNMFFNPGIVTARSIANIVSMTANNFIGNFRTAINPQIIKKFSSNDQNGSKLLLLESTKYSYFLMLILSLPIFVTAEDLLCLWLEQVPEYATVFLQFAIVTALFGVFDQSFYTAFTAKGQIKESTIFSVLIGYISFPVIYILFKMKCSPISLAWVSLISSAILAFFIKPLLLHRIMGYSWKELKILFKSCLIVTLISIPVPILFYFFEKQIFHVQLIRFFSLIVICLLCTICSIWYIGLSHDMRVQLIRLIKNKIKR
ncbi:MAG: polysaccharide biosynthesis protein [Bacteroides sp.]|nr:polysaccharide biosynthesis protein [Bacteroides sp.]